MKLTACYPFPKACNAAVAAASDVTHVWGYEIAGDACARYGALICEHARLVLDDAKDTTTRVEECSFDSESFDAGSDRLLYPSQR